MINYIKHTGDSPSELAILMNAQDDYYLYKTFMMYNDQLRILATWKHERVQLKAEPFQQREYLMALFELKLSDQYDDMVSRLG